MKLYSHWRSTTSYRVRVALNLKGMEYETMPVDLVEGQQLTGEYAMFNPGKGVPTLIFEDGIVVTPSLANIDFLDADHPEPRLVPDDPWMRARVLAAAHLDKQPDAEALA